MLIRTKSISKSNNTPKYFRNWKIISLTLGTIIKSLRNFNSNSYEQIKFLSSNSILSTLRLRSKLLLYKVIYFNKQYYSTPTIPAFPSKAYDNMVLNGGLNFLSAGMEAKKQIDSVFLAITHKCNLKCEYCYERQNINKAGDISSEKWKEIIKTLQNIGVNIFILSGGEPLLAFDSLMEILNSSDTDQSDFHLHTSGNSVTIGKVRQLKDAGLKAAAIGLDDYDKDRHDKMRGIGSFDDAVRALQLFNEAGILTYVNFCVSKEMLKADNLYRYYKFVKELGVSMIQLLEPRPCGGYFNNGSDVWLDEKDRKKLIEFTLNGNKKSTYKNYPLIYYVAHIEGKDQMGCHMGGLSHFYIDSKGNVCPCVFFPIKYGNILEENILTIHKRMRENIPFPLHTECPAVLLADKCKKIFNDVGEIPISSELIQDHIDKLFKEDQLNSGSLFNSNELFKTKGQ